MRPRSVAVVVAALLVASTPAALAQAPLDATPPTAASSPWAEAVGATPGLASWWRFGELDGTRAADRAGGNDGTYAAGVRLGAPGLIAGDPDPAIALDAAGDAFVDVGDALDFPGLSPFTVEAWIAPGEYQSPYPRILQKDGVDANGNRQGYLVYLNQQTGNLGFERWRDGRADVVTTTAPIALDRPSHVVATFDGSAMRLFVDGALAGEAPAGQDLADNPFGLRLGARSDGQSPFFGLLDEVAVYEAALAADTVAAHFAAGTADGAATLPAFDPDNLARATPAADASEAQEPSAPVTVVAVATPAPPAPETAEQPADQTIVGPPAPTTPAAEAEATQPPAVAAAAPATPAEVETPAATAEPAVATAEPAIATAPTTEPTPQAAPTATPEPVAATTTDEVNFRAGPSTDTVVIATLPAGTAVEATGEVVDGFVEVVVDGRSGWIFADFLTYP